LRASAIIARTVARGRTSPAYRSRAQRATSPDVAAIEPAPAAAVTTDVNGITLLPSDWSVNTGFEAVPVTRYPRAMGPRGFSVTCW
jgi:hypothetical protein